LIFRFADESRDDAVQTVSSTNSVRCTYTLASRRLTRRNHCVKVTLLKADNPSRIVAEAGAY